MSGPRAISLCGLPNELLLRIVEQVHYDGRTFHSIRRINRHFQQLLIEYQHSITSEVARSQYPSSSTIYPSPSLSSALQSFHWDWLAMLDHRSRTVNHVADLISQSSLQGTVPSNDLSQWLQYIEAGLHLCYRLQDSSTHDAKVAHIAGLPHLSLALIYITLIWSLRTAQRLSTGIMHADHGPSDEEQRMELCLCFEECTMQHGPDFLRSIVTPIYTARCNQCDAKINAHVILENELNVFDERQFGGVNGTLPRRTLISCLKRAIAKKAECTIEKVYGTAWATLQNDELFRKRHSLVDLVCAQ
ncbi:hypothetical protein MMC11_006805 [Xylographa trunciseda]|nr:hypothetical protein [Xylographa trunciseda]